MDDQEKINEFLRDFYPCDADNQDSHSSIKGAFLEKGLQRFIYPSFNCLNKFSHFFVCCRFIFLITPLNSWIVDHSLLHSSNLLSEILLLTRFGRFWIRSIYHRYGFKFFRNSFFILCCTNNRLYHVSF